jgi:alpha,alpha-trehalase
VIYKKAIEIPSIEIIGECLEHIHTYWQTLTRNSTAPSSTLIELPNPYIVPSNGNDNFAFEEQYYWDSYFTALGIHDEKLVSGMLDNLLYLFETFGLIPNANRYYFTSRSQPPILTTFIFHVYEKYKKPKNWLKKRITIAEKEYHEVWMSTVHPHHRNVYKNLSRYYDINALHDLAEAESGWDMTPRFKRQCLDYLPIDLNCLLYKYEADFEKVATILGDNESADRWRQISESRKTHIHSLMWSKRRAFFFDYNFVEEKMGSVYSLAGYFALWSGVATEKQAEKLVMQLAKFEKKGGLSTTAGMLMYTPLFGSTKTQWAYPNGWAPLHFIVCEGLEKYGYTKEAERIGKKWLATCANWFDKHNEFQEKYNVVNPTLPPASGLYPSQLGFGWTNGVFVAFAEKYTQ